MPKNIFSITGLLFLLLIALVANLSAQGDEYNKAIAGNARQSIQRANKLADEEKFREAAAECKKAIAAAPHFLQAHVKYINTKAYFMEEHDAVKGEYEDLSAKNPSNPVYPAALALGLIAEPDAERNKWLESVARLAPDWAWGHYFKGKLLEEKEPEAALAEYAKAIELDTSLPQPYLQAIFIQETKLKKIDDAIATAEKMASQPDLKTGTTNTLRRLRLKKAGSTEEAKIKLRAELSQIEQSSSGAAELISAHAAYQNLLKDKEAAARIEQKIKRINASWYPERGAVSTATSFNDKGFFVIVNAGRQLLIANKLEAIEYDLEPQEQTARLEQLLLLNPNRRLKKGRLFSPVRSGAGTRQRSGHKIRRTDNRP